MILETRYFRKGQYTTCTLEEFNKGTHKYIQGNNNGHNRDVKV